MWCSQATCSRRSTGSTTSPATSAGIRWAAGAARAGKRPCRSPRGRRTCASRRRSSVAFEWGRLKAAGVAEEAGVNVRVRHRGRVGVAGTTAVAGTAGGATDDVGAQHAAPLLDRALASAALGEELDLAFPAQAALPAVATFFDR